MSPVTPIATRLHDQRVELPQEARAQTSELVAPQSGHEPGTRLRTLRSALLAG